MNKITYNKTLDILDTFDVTVAGGGPAGISAAVASARCGMRTALLERYGIVGGNLTAGHVAPIMGSVSAGTMADEIIGLLDYNPRGSCHDFEKAKAKLADFLRSENVNVFLQTPVVDVIMERNLLTGVVIGGKNGVKVIKSKVIIDATGDGDVASYAGCNYGIGREDGLLQPTSLMFTIAGVDDDRAIFCRHEEDDSMLPSGSYLKLCRDAEKNGKLPKNVGIVRLYPSSRKDERVVNATQANGINGLKHEDIFKAETLLRAQMQQVQEFIKKHVPGCENSYIKNSSDTLGVRETRRITGEYTLNSDDLINGRKFDDAAVHNACFPIDIHNPSGAGQAETEGVPRKALPYDIPYRCFVPEKVDNLLIAGRCISGTHRAHASYRAMKICMAMGQAVGISAALCAKQNVIPRKLEFSDVQKHLKEIGVILHD